MSCTIVNPMHDGILVVQGVVNDCAPGARHYMSGARCRAPSCTGCTMLYGCCTMLRSIVYQVHDIILVVDYVVHHRAPGARCYMGGARCYMGGARSCAAIPHYLCP